MITTFAVIAFGWCAARLLYRSPKGSIRQGLGAALMVLGDGLLLALIAMGIIPTDVMLVSLLGNCLGLLDLSHLSNPLRRLGSKIRQLRAARAERARRRRQALKLDRLLPEIIRKIDGLRDRCDASDQLRLQKVRLTRLGAYLEDLLERYRIYSRTLAELQGIPIDALRATGADEALAQLATERGALEGQIRLLDQTIEALPVFISAAELSGDTSRLDLCLDQIEQKTDAFIPEEHRRTLRIYDEIAALERPVQRLSH